MKISISVLTYNRKNILRKNLELLSAIKYSPLEIIVVDNCSDDGTEQMISQHFPEVKYIRTSTNMGVGARNTGLKKATGEIIITLDDDVLGITREHLHTFIKYFGKRPELGAVNFKVVDLNERVCNWVHHRRQEHSEEEFLTYEITEGAVAFRKEALERTGYYPDYFFLSHEGPDLAFRILGSGYKVIYTPAVTVVHHHSALGRKNWFRYYFDTRNQFWLAARNLPIGYAIRFLMRGGVSTLIYAVRDGYLLYWLKGVRDGIAGIRRAFNDRNRISNSAMKLVKEIDRNRPSLFYMAKIRLFRKEMRL